jgi:hypothetical protein
LRVHTNRATFFLLSIVCCLYLLLSPVIHTNLFCRVDFMPLAALATGNNNAEAAMEWVFAHMEDPDFNDPLPPPAAAAAPAAAGAQQQQQQDPEKVRALLIGRFVSPGQSPLQVTACHILYLSLLLSRQSGVPREMCWYLQHFLFRWIAQRYKQQQQQQQQQQH